MTTEINKFSINEDSKSTADWKEITCISLGESHLTEAYYFIIKNQLTFLFNKKLHVLLC